MAITGAALVLFVTFHCLMNGVALFWPSAYNCVCEFLGANWYALIASAGLAALFIIHIIYALWLTVQNRKARGNDRYKVVSKPKQVEWASQNMLVLGIVILAFLVLHLIQFWAKMQFAEIFHITQFDPEIEGVPVPAAAGTWFIQMAFSQWYTLPVYLIGFIALWFHMNHGMWSMFQSIGWNGQVWFERLKKIACWWTSVVVLLFIAQGIVFTVNANNRAYTECPCLQEQYMEMAAQETPAPCCEAAAADCCGKAADACCGKCEDNACKDNGECCGKCKENAECCSETVIVEETEVIATENNTQE